MAHCIGVQGTSAARHCCRQAWRAPSASLAFKDLRLAYLDSLRLFGLLTTGKGEIALDGALLRRRSGQLSSPPLLSAGPPGVEAKFVALDSLRRRRSGQLGSPPTASPPRSAMGYGTGYPPPAGAPDKPEQAYVGSQRRRLGQADSPPLPVRHGEGCPPAP